MSSSSIGQQQSESVIGSNLTQSQPPPRGRVGFCMWLVGPLVYIWGGYEVHKQHLPDPRPPQPPLAGLQQQQQHFLLQNLQQHLADLSDSSEADSDENNDDDEDWEFGEDEPPVLPPQAELLGPGDFADDDAGDEGNHGDEAGDADGLVADDVDEFGLDNNQPDDVNVDANAHQLAAGDAYYRQSTWVPGHQLLCYCTDSRKWFKISLDLRNLATWTHQCRNFMSGFSGSACCSNSDNSQLYISGGFNESVHYHLSATNAVYAIRVNGNKQPDRAGFPVTCLFSMETRGPPGQLVPMPRDKHSAIYWRNQLIIFGGYCLNPPTTLMDSVDYCGSQLGLQDVFFKPECFQPNDSLRFAWSNELLQFDLSTGAWSQLDPQGCAPTPRAAHSMIRIDTRALLFGGRVLDRRTNDLFCLCLETLQWTRLEPSGCLPEPRSWTTFVQVGPGHVFCFGGYPWAEPPAQLRPFNNCFLYDLAANLFRQLKLKSRPGLLWHGSCAQLESRSAFVWGGCTEDIMLPVYRRDFNADVLEFPRLLVPSLASICSDLVVRLPDVYPLGALKLHWPVTAQLIQRRLLMSGPLLGG